MCVGRLASAPLVSSARCNSDLYSLLAFHCDDLVFWFRGARAGDTFIDSFGVFTGSLGGLVHF